MNSSRTNTARVSTLLSALLLGAAATAGAQGLSSGSNTGGRATGTVGAGQPALAAPSTAATTNAATPQGATPTPSAATPLPGQSTLPQQLPPLNAGGVAGQTATTATPGSIPTRTSTAAEAFTSLDRGGVGYVTRADTDRIPGFVGFDNADSNRDGQLTKDEFANAWRRYSGQ